jgi:hypothetical protein
MTACGGSRATAFRPPTLRTNKPAVKGPVALQLPEWRAGSTNPFASKLGGDLHEFGKLGKLVSAKEAESLV